MLFSDRIHAGMEFHKIGPLYLILNCSLLAFTDSRSQFLDDLVQ